MHQPNPVDHARHDLDLIAAHVAGDLSDLERVRADQLLQSCTSCAELRRELIAIAAATRALPRMASAPRDFRLTVDQAARLRRGSWLRRVLEPFARTRSAVRPMAAALTGLGFAGLLVANLSLLGGVASAPAPAGNALGGGGAFVPTAAGAPGASAGSAEIEYGAAGQPSQHDDTFGTRAGSQ